MKELKKILDEHKVENEALYTELQNFVDGVVTQATNRNISKSRYDKKLKEITELNGQISDLESKINQLEQDNSNLREKANESETLRSKLNSYEEQQKKAVLDKWEKAKQKIDVKENDPDYEKINKVRGRFNLESDDINDINKNLEAFELLDTAGFFASKESDVNDRPPRGDANKPKYRPFKQFST